jgi:hypothetical protein
MDLVLEPDTETKFLDPAQIPVPGSLDKKWEEGAVFNKLKVSSYSSSFV